MNTLLDAMDDERRWVRWPACVVGFLALLGMQVGLVLLGLLAVGAVMLALIYLR